MFLISNGITSGRTMPLKSIS